MINEDEKTFGHENDNYNENEGRKRKQRFVEICVKNASEDVFLGHLKKYM